MASNKSNNLSNLYFIFADNVYMKYLDYEKFKALINFYALIYDKIIIPDTFFINNDYLIKFISSDQGKDYINKNIIVPSVRSSSNNLMEVYEAFKENGTLASSADNSIDLMNCLESLNLNNAIRWNIEEIAKHFQNQVFGNINNLEIIQEDKEVFISNLENIKSKKNLTRQLIRNALTEINFSNYKSKEMLESYVDITYNFNIPNFLQTSAAYPEKLVVKNNISPEKVYFKSDISNNHVLAISKKEIINTSFFNIGILSNLNSEQLCHLRKLKQYKSFVNTLNKADSELLLRKFVDYLDEFDKELPQIISLENKQALEKNKKKLAIFNFGQESISGDGVGFLVDLALDGIASYTGSKILGKAFKVLTKKFTQNIEHETKLLQLEGKSKIKELESSENIYNALKQFSLNSIN